MKLTVDLGFLFIKKKKKTERRYYSEDFVIFNTFYCNVVAPGPARKVSVLQLSNTVVMVKWNEPFKTNGIILGMLILIMWI